MSRRPRATPAPAGPWVPSLEEALGLLAGHVKSVMTAQPGRSVSFLTEVYFGCGLGGWEGTGCPSVLLEGKIEAATGACAADGGPWGEWAQVTLNGQSCGNRHGAARAIAEAYAPVIAWVAAYHAARATAAIVASSDKPAIAKAG